MTIFESAMQNLSHYPRWFVVACAAVVVAAAIWLAMKVLKWTLYVAAIAALVLITAGLVVWWLK